MASGYALPTANGSYHSHSHSYSGVYSSPGKAPRSPYTGSNGNFVKETVSNSSINSFLYPHAESSRETSPIPFPNFTTNNHNHHNLLSSFEQNDAAFKQNARLSDHKHSHSSPSMKSRPRGESDLGRPAEVRSPSYEPTLQSIPAASRSWFSLPEALTSMLIPLPYLLASTAFSATTSVLSPDFPPLAAYISPIAEPGTNASITRLSLINASILTSGTLLVVGIIGKLQSSERASNRGKNRSGPVLDIRVLANTSALRSMTTSALSLGLPLYACMLLGGTRTSLVLLVAAAANIMCSDFAHMPLMQQWTRLWRSRVATSAVLILCFISDEIGLTVQTPLTELILGYMALALSVLVLPPPYPTSHDATRTQASPGSTPSRSPMMSLQRPGTAGVFNLSPLTYSPLAIDATLTGGIALALLTVVGSTLLATAPSISISSILLNTLTVATMAAAVLLSQPSSLRSESKAGLALGCLTTASCSFLFSPSLWPGTVCNGGLCALSFLSVLYDTSMAGVQSGQHHDDHEHTHNENTHTHTLSSKESGPSVFTRFLLAQCEPGSLVSSILNEKDSRRIAYFTTLNFAFMLVQGAYGYLSGSLGLLSDTVHMFFDCLGLIVGLGAAVASKWPTSPEKPYGWGKLNTLAGFGNGIFLMLVSVEFIWEAIEGMLEGTELRHVQELLVVSTLGLLVNMVGLFAFGHAHAGHDHGHSHSHGHDHGHSHSHGGDHRHSYRPEHSHAHSHHEHHQHKDDHSCIHANGHAHSPSRSSDHTHDPSSGYTHNHETRPHHPATHDHHNENMHGIFLHVAADAGGSLAVIISTALTLWKPWYLWDPLATIIIAVLIFAAAVPLVTSSGQKLLLVIPDELEYGIKNALQEIGELRGVLGYAGPRFWLDDREEGREGHEDHGHGHPHEHEPHGSPSRVKGVVHVIAAPAADLQDVRDRVQHLLAGRRMDVVVHVERDGEGQCWCGGAGPH